MKKIFLILILVLSAFTMPKISYACFENENRDSVEVLFGETVIPKIETFGRLSDYGVKCKQSKESTVCAYISSYDENYMVTIYAEPVSKSGSATFTIKGKPSLGVKITPIASLSEDKSIDIDKLREVLEEELNWISEIGGVENLTDEEISLAVKAVGNGTAGDDNKIIFFNGGFLPYNQTGLPAQENCGLADAELFVNSGGNLIISQTENADFIAELLGIRKSADFNEENDNSEPKRIPTSVWILLMIAIVAGSGAGFYIKKNNIIVELSGKSTNENTERVYNKKSTKRKK